MNYTLFRVLRWCGTIHWPKHDNSDLNALLKKATLAVKAQPIPKEPQMNNKGYVPSIVSATGVPDFPASHVAGQMYERRNADGSSQVYYYCGENWHPVPPSASNFTGEKVMSLLTDLWNELGHEQGRVEQEAAVADAYLAGMNALMDSASTVFKGN
jgi:hypothetical protein